MKIREGVEAKVLVGIATLHEDVRCDKCGATVKAYDKSYTVGEHELTDSDGYGKMYTICSVCGEEIERKIAEQVAAQFGKRGKV